MIGFVRACTDLALHANRKGKITYEARPPKDIKFAPLNKDTEYTAEQMMELYEVSY
jgi:phenylalanyl-tRNA synthetase beta chain